MHPTAQSVPANALQRMDELTFSQVYGGFPQAAWIVENERLRCVAANRKSSELFQLPQDELLRRTMADMWTPEDYASWLALREEGGEPRWRSWQRTGMLGNGTTMCMRLHSTLVEWKGASAELSVLEPHVPNLYSNENSMQSMVEHSGAPLARYSLEQNRLTYANLAFSEVIGCESDAARRLAFADATMLPQMDLLQAAFLNVSEWAQFLAQAAQGRPFVQQVMWLCGKDKRRHIRLQATPVRLGGEEELLLHAEDTGAELRREIQTRHMQKMEALGRMAGGVAHDFNNLLLIIRGHAELINDSIVNTDLHGHMSKLLNATRQAAGITSTLLTFSRHEQQPIDPVSLHDTVRQSVELVPSLLRKNVGLDVELASLEFYVSALPVHIEQVLMNLCVNARDAMPHGGRITIRTGYRETADGGMALLEVSDTGVGMDAETRAHIFEPFYTTKERGRGTGLGLALVYGIVTQYGGQVEVESSLGQGATFRVLLPITAEPKLAVAPPKPSVAQAGKKTVLVVDDEPEIRGMVSEFVRKMGHDVYVAGDAAAAIAVAEEHGSELDAVLTDVVMPKTDGFELALMLREKKPGLPVIVMSGFTGGAMARKGKELGKVPFLLKPFSRLQLEAALKSLFETAAENPGSITSKTA